MTFTEWRGLSLDSPDQVLQAFRERCDGIDPQEIAPAIAWQPDSLPAIEAGDESADRPGEWRKRPLAGVPFLVKDLYDVVGWPTNASSTFLSSVRGIPESTSPLVRRLSTLGATPVGKTHLNEFAYGLSGRNAHYGHCRHPQFPGRLSGGSSSGSAWAVSRGLVPLALGTDTGGSVRVPASFCGIYGLRLTPDEWSHDGCFPLSPGLDTAGWFCRTPGDMVEVTGLLLDPEASDGELRGVTLESEGLAIDPDLSKAYNAFTGGIGLKTDQEINREYRSATEGLIQTYSVIQSREALEIHEPWIEEYRDAYQPVVLERIVRGRAWSRSDVDAAETGRERLHRFFDRLFEEHEFAVLPATPFPAPLVDRMGQESRLSILTLTAPASIGTLPVLTVPVFLDSGLSGGLQFIYRDPASDIPIRLLNEILG